jgi:hypothetical protein
MRSSDCARSIPTGLLFGALALNPWLANASRGPSRLLRPHPPRRQEHGEGAPSRRLCAAAVRHAPVHSEGLAASPAPVRADDPPATDGTAKACPVRSKEPQAGRPFRSSNPASPSTTTMASVVPYCPICKRLLSEAFVADKHDCHGRLLRYGDRSALTDLTSGAFPPKAPTISSNATRRLFPPAMKRESE